MTAAYGRYPAFPFRVAEDGRTACVADPVQHVTEEVVQLILKHFGRPQDDFDHVTDRAGHDRRYAIESGKLRAELGWSPRFQDFEAGLADTITWYQEHEDWWRPHKQATEAFYATKGQ